MIIKCEYNGYDELVIINDIKIGKIIYIIKF